MNADFSAEEQAFQQQVRSWLADNVPADPIAEFGPGKAAIQGWEQRLATQGWVCPNWPEKFGGPGWTATQRYIWDQECARAGAPGNSVFGPSMCGPVIMAFGTPEQQEQHLPHIRNATRFWCQGYSEPGSGSDLASLKTRAERDGDDYIVNGQKIWTTYAQYADWCFCLVRTEQAERKQDGISFLLIDMTTPGIEVRPIISIDGEHSLNEVFFTNVRVPTSNRVGKEGQGWSIAKFLLGHERTTIAGVPASKQSIEGLKALNAADPALDNDPAIGTQIAEMEIDLMALEYTNLRALERAEAGQPPGPESSGLKIKGTELQQAITGLRVEMGGYSSLPWKTDAVGQSAYAQAVTQHNYLRAATIYGGSNEIQKNVLAKYALGL